jgi:hypothetical protein
VAIPFTRQIGAHVLSVKSTKSFENFSNNRCPSKNILALTIGFELVKVSKNSNTKSVFWFLQKLVQIKKKLAQHTALNVQQFGGGLLGVPVVYHDTCATEHVPMWQRYWIPASANWGGVS